WRVLAELAGAVMAVEAMATGAILGEEFRSLDERVIADEENRPAGGHALVMGEHLDAFGVAPGVFDGELIGGVVAILELGHGGEHRRSAKQREEESDVELMPDRLAADERHQEEDRENDRGNHNRAVDLGVAGEIFQELEH